MEKRSFFLLRIPQENNKKEDVASDFFSQIAEILKGRDLSISIEIANIGKYLWFFLSCPAAIKSVIKGQWYSQYPHAEIEEVKEYTDKLFYKYELKGVAGCELYYEHSEYIPLKTYKELQKNPLVSLAGLVNSFLSEETGIIQLVLEPPKKENIWNKFLKQRRENRRMSIAASGEKPEYITLEEDKEEKSNFKTTIRIITFAKDSDKASLNLSSILAVYKKSLERPKLQKLKEDFRNDKKFIESFRGRVLGRHTFAFSPDEIATFFHLPYIEEEISQVMQLRSKRAAPPQNLPNVSTSTDLSVFGGTNFQNEKTTFGIKTNDRRRHLYIIGKTGMGKSKMLELLVKTDILNGKGVILIDPHGDLTREILNFIPEKRINDVVYFNPTDMDFPIGFNPMEGVGSFEFKQNMVNGFISIFKKFFGLNWNERFEHVLRYTTLALLDYPNASILGIPRMLTDTVFRQNVISYISDPLVKKFWTTEFSGWNDQYAGEAIVPIINKIGQFVANPMIRNIVGQEKTGFSLDDVMNKQKILLANFSIGKLGEENSALLGSMLVTKIWQTAIARASIPEEERIDTFMYVDEFQNFATSTFAQILSEARKYHLNLTVAHQYMQQLTQEIRATIFGNVGNIISFRVGGEDAQILVKEFEPVFSVNDFLNLDMRNFFIKMSIDGQTAKPFSAETLFLEKPAEDKAQRIIESSRKMWATERANVEKEIERWEKGKVKEDILDNEPFFPEPII